MESWTEEELKKLRQKGYKTTSEIAKNLDCLNTSITNYRSRHSEQFVGEVVKLRLSSTKSRYYWSPNAQKRLGLGMQLERTEPLQKYKEDVIEKVVENKFFIDKDADPQKMLPTILRYLADRFETYDKKFDQIENKFEIHQRTSQNTKLIQKVRKLLTSTIQFYNTTWQTVWIPIRDHLECGGYNDLTIEQCQFILRELPKEENGELGIINWNIIKKGRKVIDLDFEVT